MKECVYLFLEPIDMPCWYYDKKDLKVTPSIQDGLSFDTERRYRKEGARFIMNCGTAMGLGHNTMATGVVYFHRFYIFHSFKNFPRYVTACCCLFLAGKVEETPKKCRDIIKTARGLLTDHQFQSFGEDPKEEVMTLERILLQTIKFDLQVEHPYSFLVKYAKCLKGDQGKLQKMVQMAWNFVNDSLSTTVCLQWEPEIIAVALIHLASKLSKFTVVDWIGRHSSHLRWWDMFVADVTMEILEDICHQVLDLYQHNQSNNNDSRTPPQQQPTRASSPAKNPNTPPPAAKSSSASGSAIDDKLEMNSSSNPLPAKLVPPPLAEPMHYLYPTNYSAMFPGPAPHYPTTPIPSGAIASPAPPLAPPPAMYSSPYIPPPQVPPHYTTGPPMPCHRQPLAPSQQTSHQPPPPYYGGPSYGRPRYPPPQEF